MIVFRIVYGITIKEENDEFVALAERALQITSEGLRPGKFLVQYLPFLRYVPSWMPGTGWQRQFKEWHDASARFQEEPFAHVQRAIVSTFISLRVGDKPYQCLLEQQTGDLQCSIAAKFVEELRSAHLSGLQFKTELEIAKSVCAVAVEGNTVVLKNLSNAGSPRHN